MTTNPQALNEFFGYNEEDVKSYGSIVYEFKTNKRLKLLALDKNIKSFYDYALLPNNIKEILKNRYGYDGTKAVIRDSNSKEDNEFVDYLSKNNFDGYATNLMDKVDGFDGLFHREIVICQHENYNTPTIKSQLSPGKIKKLNQEARLLQNNKEQKHTRKKQRRLSSRSPSPSRISLTSRNLFDSPSPKKSPKKLFDGKRRRAKNCKTSKRKSKSNKYKVIFK